VLKVIVFSNAQCSFCGAGIPFVQSLRAEKPAGHIKLRAESTELVLNNPLDDGFRKAV